MVVFGLMFLMAAFLTMCCGFQLGCFRRAAEAHNAQQQQQQQQVQDYVPQVSSPIPLKTTNEVRGASSETPTPCVTSKLHHDERQRRIGI